MTKKAEQYKEWDREDRYHPKTGRPHNTKDVLKKYRNKLYEFSQYQDDIDEYELDLYHTN